jgi:hypothetical protein
VRSIPDSVRVCDSVPFNILLSTCSAIVHNHATTDTL